LQQDYVPTPRHILAFTLCACFVLTGPASAVVAGSSMARTAVEVAAWGKTGPKKKAKRPRKKARRKKARRKKARRKKARRHSDPPPASASHRRLNPLLKKGSSLPDLLAPYSLKRVFRGFGKCRRGKHTHQALDIGGVGENAGLGTPVFAMARSKVTLIGLPEEDARQFGKPDRGKGTVRRGHKGRLVLPKQERIPGYGRVTYFTRDYGSWRSGVVISTRVVDGPMKGHEIRYMHLGAVHPTLKRGVVIEAGEEIGLMGGTAILDSAPHVHVDMTDLNGERVDIARLLGLPQAAKPCPSVVESTQRVRRRKSKARKRR
jgi:murein DD-endopeptidase MepM/ murein hydrolase activator NlpD